MLYNGGTFSSFVLILYFLLGVFASYPIYFSKIFNF